MTLSRLLPLAVLSLLAVSLAVAEPPAAPKLPPDHAERLVKGKDLFTRHVRTVLIDQCVKCHGGEKTRGSLDLTTREGLLKGGDSGPAVVPFASKDSLLSVLVHHQEHPIK